MNIYLVRHGDAVDASENPQRPLSPLGEQQIELIAQQLKIADVQVDTIFHSGILRAKQTTEILAQRLPHKNIVAWAMLAPDQSFSLVFDELVKIKTSVMLVGHQPMLGMLASYMMTKRSNSPIVNIDKGDALCFSPSKFKNELWMLDWMLKPSLLAYPSGG